MIDINPPIPTSAKRVLIVGGSFDPPHRAHMAMARRVMELSRCDRILFVPSGQRAPLKAEAHSSAADRLAMLQLAVAAMFSRRQPSPASITTFELHQQQAAYSIDTISELRQHLPDSTALCLMIGSDQALQFRKWRDWEKILDLVEPVVVPRPPHDAESLRLCSSCQLDDRLRDAVVDVAADDVSSTMVRKLILLGRDLQPYVGEPVAAYIAAHHLYRPEKSARTR